MTTFVQAYSRRTGRIQRIPTAWLEHPMLGQQFTQTPSMRKPEEKAATRHEARTTSTTASTTPTPDITPADGDKE